MSEDSDLDLFQSLLYPWYGAIIFQGENRMKNGTVEINIVCELEEDME